MPLKMVILDKEILMLRGMQKTPTKKIQKVGCKIKYTPRKIPSISAIFPTV